MFNDKIHKDNLDRERKEWLSLAVRRFQVMVGTEFSGQEKDERFIESALLWNDNKDEMQKAKAKRGCSCGEGLELRNFLFQEKDIIFLYRCDFCFEHWTFKYKRGN